MNKKFCIAILIPFLIASAVIEGSGAPAGGLDTTFGTNGTVITPLAGFIRAIAIQPDGKVIAVGEGGTMTVVRYNIDGSLDLSFNGTGIAQATGGSAGAVAIQPDGKIVVVGDNGNIADIDLKVVRYNSNGTFDTTFDGDGIVTMAIGEGTDIGFGVAIQPDGKIVISGRSDTPPNYSTSYAVIRFNANGSVDTTFGTQGVVIPQYSGTSFSHQLALQPDGKIVVVCNRVFQGVQYLLVLRYTSNGQLDPMFGVNGVVETAIGLSAEYAAVALQTDRKIVVSCSSFVNATGADFVVARFNTDGSFDDTFGAEGIVRTPVGPGASQDHAKSLAIQPNGKIVLGGVSVNGTNRNFVVVRYNRNGSLDRKWGNNGIVTTDPGGSHDEINAIAVQANGRIVAAGQSNAIVNSVPWFALARYVGDTAENFDYDRDGNSDISVYRPSSGEWYLLRSSSNSLTGLRWGISTDRVASADYDGDLQTDVAVWRPGVSGILYILNSFDHTVKIVPFGQTGDDPSIVGDYDGDGKADPAVYRAGAAPGQPSVFYYRGSLNNPNGDITFIPWGTNGDIAARGDFNGNGRLDPTVFRPSSGVWYSLNLMDNSFIATRWGLSTDKLVPADYTGDGKTDHAIFRNGIWYILQSETGQPQYASWGLPTDKPVPADYDGDGMADVAVYRDGIWYLRQSSAGDRYIAFGLSTDIPTPASYLP